MATGEEKISAMTEATSLNDTDYGQIVQTTNKKFFLTTLATYIKNKILGTGSVTATELATDAVTTTKIKNANVTNAKLEAGTQTTLGHFDAADGYKLKTTGLKDQTKTVTTLTAPTPDYIGQPGRDASGNNYVAIALSGTMWELVEDKTSKWQVLYTRTRLGQGKVYWDEGNGNLVFDNLGAGNTISLVLNQKDSTGKLAEVVLGVTSAGIVNVNLGTSAANDPSVICVKNGKLNLGTTIDVETAGNLFLANRTAVGADDLVIGYLQGGKISSPLLYQVQYPEAEPAIPRGVVYGAQIPNPGKGTDIYYNSRTKKLVFTGLTWNGSATAVKLLWGEEDYTYLSTSGFALGCNEIEIDLTTTNWNAVVVVVGGRVSGSTVLLQQSNFAIRAYDGVLDTDLILGYLSFGEFFNSLITNREYNDVTEWLVVGTRIRQGTGDVFWDKANRELVFANFGLNNSINLVCSHKITDNYNNWKLTEVALNIPVDEDVRVRLDNSNSNDPSVICVKNGKLNVGTVIDLNSTNIYLSNRNAVPADDLVIGYVQGDKISSPILTQIQQDDISNLSANSLSAITSFLQNEPHAPLTVMAINGDSIMASGIEELTYPYNSENQYEVPPRNNVSMLQRYIYDYLNWNKPKFRNSAHSDWVDSGTWVYELTAKQPRVDKLSYPTANGDSKTIVVDGADGEWFGLIFEGIGARTYLNSSNAVYGTAVYRGGSWVSPPSTGVANITVAESSDGGVTYTPFAAPSAYASIKGKWNVQGYLDANGDEAIEYDAATDSFDTAPTVSGSGTYDECSFYNVYYHLDTTKKYKFRVSQNTAAATNPIRFWGSMQWSGKTVVVNNFAIPGLNWDQIAEYSKGDYLLSECNYMLVEAPIYHDNTIGLDEVKTRVQSFIEKIYSYASLQMLVFSCSPGGIATLGGSVTAGDPLPATYPGENVYLQFERDIKILSPTVSVDPDYKDTYSITVYSTTYTLSFKRKVDGDYVFLAPEGMPLNYSGSVTLTRLTGSGDATITGSNGYVKYIAFTMPEHAYAVSQICALNNVYFVDALNVFKQIAESHGDVLDDETGFDMPSTHPDYSTIDSFYGNPSYPYLTRPYKMNYMSNFFVYGDGHHLKFTAHKIFMEALKKVFANSYFKL